MVTMNCPVCNFRYQAANKPSPEQNACPCGKGAMEVIESPEPTPISRICRLCVNRGSLCIECPILGLNNNPDVHFSDIVE